MRELRELREREVRVESSKRKRKKQINNILIRSENKKLFYFLTLNYHVHLFIDVHYSNEVKKI